MATQFATGIIKGKDSFIVGQKAAELALKKMTVKPDIAIVFCSPEYQYVSAILGLKSIVGEIPVVGCSSAGEFTEQLVTKGGFACALIASDTHKFYSGIGKGIKKNQVQTLQYATKNFPAPDSVYKHSSVMMFIDGMMGRGEETVLAAASLLGPNVKFAGGAAGDDLKFKNTSVFYNGIPFDDAVSLCLIRSKTPVCIGIKHGHTPVTEPLKVTKVDESILQEIEGRPAWEIWKNQLKPYAEKMGLDLNKLKPEQIPEFILKFQAGLKIGEEYKLRFPLSINADGTINFSCNVPEGSVIKIMDTDHQKQIDAARLAAEAALKQLQGKPLAGAIVFDCCCRSALLKEKFPQAIEAIKTTLGDVPLIGVETYGEIGMEGGQLSGFHNTTTVVLLIPA